jgi:hypothetical protein
LRLMKSLVLFGHLLNGICFAGGPFLSI